MYVSSSVGEHQGPVRFVDVPTLVRDPQPVELEAMLERRRRLGQDLFDEAWDRVLHVNPTPSGEHGDLQSQVYALLRSTARQAELRMLGRFNLGEEGDYRVPDGGLHRDPTDRVYYPTATLVIEIVSPGDETWEKLPFYAANEVEELLIVDPEARKVTLLALQPSGEYSSVERSEAIELGAAELAGRIDWR